MALTQRKFSDQDLKLFYRGDGVNEVWKDIPGYEGLYQVSSLGRIKSLSRSVNRSNGVVQRRSEKVVKQSNSRGYKTFKLRNNDGVKTVRVHRVVAELFLGKAPDGMVVNHKDGNKSNNTYTNLEWVTQKENVRHAVDIGCVDHRKKGIICSDLKGNLVKEFESIAKATEWLRLNGKPKARKSPISACSKNKKHYNTAYGFKWSYKE